MASQGPLNPGTMASNNGNGGAVAWSNPTNAGASDNVRATATLTAVSTNTEYLKCTNLGFTIPAGATIDGIIVEVERSRNGTGTITDQEVKIVKSDGTVGSTNKADTATNYGTTDAYITYGSSSDKWGETWTSTDINDADFGFVFSSVHGSGVNPQTRVDHGRVTVHYTASSGISFEVGSIAF